MREKKEGVQADLPDEEVKERRSAAFRRSLRLAKAKVA